MRIITSLICLLLSCTGFAQHYTGPHSASLGNANSSMEGIWSMQANPAGLAGIDLPSFELAYMSIFLDRELSARAALIAFPVGDNSFGLSLQQYGIKQYQETTIGITYSRQFGKQLSLGATLYYHALDVANYGGAKALSVKTGFQCQINSSLKLAAFISNPSRSSFYEEYASIPLIAAVGIRWANEPTAVYVDYVRELGAAGSLKSGLELFINSSLSAGAGISLNPFKKYAGFTFISGKIVSRFAVEVQARLGVSPQISTGYVF